MPDTSARVEELKEQVKDFCTVREWDQYHSAKDLAIGVSTEASELLELFRFKNDLEISELMKDNGFRKACGEELADVLYFVLRFAQINGFDLSDELHCKLELNSKKYPVEKARGSNKKYTDL